MSDFRAPKASAPDEPLIGVAALAVWLDVSEHTVKKWVSRGPGAKSLVPTPIRVNGVTKFRPQDVRDWIESKAVRP